MIFSRKKGFTIWEILIVIVVVSVGLMSVISILTYAFGFVQKSRQKVIAINLAREGIESVYQIRDTNRQRWAWKKEECWLKKDPLNANDWIVGNDPNDCADDHWMGSWSYILSGKSLWGQYYLLLDGPYGDQLNLGDGLSGQDKTYSLCLTWWLWLACPYEADNTTREWRYFRQILWYGVYDKVGEGSNLNCSNGNNSPCNSGDVAKEFRFCSRVVYLGNGSGEVRLCWLLTNFAE